MFESIYPQQDTRASKRLPWAHRGHCPKPWGCSKAQLPLWSTEGLESAVSINKSSQVPEGESLNLPPKTTCILIPQQLFMRKPSPQQLPELPLSPWVQDKALPSVPALPSRAPGTGRRAPGSSCYPGTGSPGWQQNSNLLPKSSSRAQGLGGEQLSSCSLGCVPVVGTGR